MRKEIKILLAAALCAVIFGCASAPSKPDWVLKGSGAFEYEEKVFYGVGIAEGITSIALRRTTADNRAIAEVSKQIKVVSSSLMRDYMASAQVAETGETTGEQYIDNTVKTFTDNTLSGIRIIDRYDDGTVGYSLAKLDLEELKAMTEDINQLSQEVKEYIKENAEKAFDKLDAERE